MKIKKTFVKQKEQSDCGVACLLSVIRYYGGNTSLENLRILCGTSIEGTTLLGLYQGANEIGFNAKGKEATISNILTKNKPVIIHVINDEGQNHYVVYYGCKDDKIIIGDPEVGIIEVNSEYLEKIWKSGYCLLLKPNSNFNIVKDQNNEKRKWFIKIIKEDSRLIRFSIFLGFFIAALGMSMAVFSQKLIDEILPSQKLQTLIIGVFLLFFILTTKILLNALRDYFLTVQSKDFNIRINKYFYSSLLQLPKVFYDSREIGELVTRLNDTQRIQKVIKQILGSVIINIITSLVSISFLFFYSWEIGVIAFISLPFYFLFIYKHNNLIIKNQKNVMRGYAANENNYINSMQGIATVKNFNRQGYFEKKNERIYGFYQNTIFKLDKLNIKLSLFSGGFSILFLITILGFASLKVLEGFLEIGELVAILSISGPLLPMISNLALIAIPINEAKVAFDRMYEFSSMQKENTGKIVVKKFRSLEIKNLSFRFPGRSSLLKNLNLIVSRNECIAIIGESGCGKSTFSQIIQKFYDYEDGTILINSKFKLEELKVKEWREIIATIPQDVTLFNGTISYNITLNEDNNEQNVLEFCKNLGFEKIINNFPNGLFTLVGEGGVNLSGGQKQLIALLRALFKNPQLLILDEFTSAMDRKTEKFALDLLRSLKTEITIIMISHRLHTLNLLADNIYIIEEGIIKDSGSHDELMETDNFYSSFWTNLKPKVNKNN